MSAIGMGSGYGVAGLGITFLPSSPIQDGGVETLSRTYHSPEVQHYRPLPLPDPSYLHGAHHHRGLQHSISYDDGFHRSEKGRYDRMAAEPMIRYTSQDSAYSLGDPTGVHRAYGISIGRQVYGGPTGDKHHLNYLPVIEQHSHAKPHYHDPTTQYQGLHHISPLSELESNASSDSETYSYASLLSLPLSTSASSKSVNLSNFPLPPTLHRLDSTQNSLPVEPLPYIDQQYKNANNGIIFSDGNIGQHNQATEEFPHPSTSNESYFDSMVPRESNDVHRVATSAQGVPYYRPHPNHESSSPIASKRTNLALQKGNRTLTRPKSMMELGELYALQALERRMTTMTVSSEEERPQHRPDSVENIPSRHDALARQRLSKSVNVFQRSRHHQEKEEDEVGGSENDMHHDNHDEDNDDNDDDDADADDDDDCDHLNGLDSPESIPSSAGGLQRRNLERQLQQRRYENARAISALTKSYPAQQVEQSLRTCASHPTLRNRAKSFSISQHSSNQREVSSPEHTEQHPYPRFAARRSLADLRSLNKESEQSTSGKSEVTSNRNSVTNSTEARSTSLTRQTTLLTAGANPVRRSKELDRLLAPTSKKAISSNSSHSLTSIAGSPVSSHATSSVAPSSRGTSNFADQTITSPVMLEQTKSSKDARVELDLVLETALVVEGGTMRGRIEMRVRAPKEKEAETWLAQPKVRVVGFEELASEESRYIFYHHSTTISSSAPATKLQESPLPCHDAESTFDNEGFGKSVTGQHLIPFCIVLPIGKGAKGTFKGKQGVVRYIAIVSVKLKSKEGHNRSIAHFYRHLDIFPYYNPAILLAPALKPLLGTASKALFMGGNGKVTLSAKIHRGAWVSGQRCYIDVRVENQSSKKIKTLTLTLVRTTTTFRPRSHSLAAYPQDVSAEESDSSKSKIQSQATKKKVAESTLEMGRKGNKGVTAKGNWLGVDPGEIVDFSHFLLVPPDALSISRGQHLEVNYTIKASVGGSLSTDVTAEVPIRVVNFVSLDPPPGHSGELISPIASRQMLNKTWSVEQLRGTRLGKNRAELKTRPNDIGNTLRPIMSFDSLQISDLNHQRENAAWNSAHRAMPIDTTLGADQDRPRSNTASGRQEPTDAESTLHSHSLGQMILGKAVERRLNHQMSLECISSAIASATARRMAQNRSESTLRSELAPISLNGQLQHGESWRARSNVPQQFTQHYDSRDGIQLDDLEDDEDDGDYAKQVYSVFEDEDESEDDELETMMSHSKFDDEEPVPFDSHSGESKPLVRPKVINSRSASFVESRPSSPTKTSGSQLPSRRGSTFAYATPASPVKAIAISLPSPVKSATPLSPVGRQRPGVNSAPTATRSARPLPVAPDSISISAGPMKESSSNLQGGSHLQKKPSTSSLRRGANVIARRPSSKSLSSVNASSVLSPSVSSATESESEPSCGRSVIRPKKSQQNLAKSPAASPRKALSPPLPSPSVGSVRRNEGSMGPPPPRRANVLPSVRNKVDVLESRQNTFARLASTKGGHSQDTHQALSPATSNCESEASFNFSRLNRADSTMSFKAPMLRRPEGAV